VEAGGIEPKSLGNKGFTKAGHEGPTGGQPSSECGQRAGVVTTAQLLEGSNSGQAGATSGEKWNVRGASVGDVDFARVVAAWPGLQRPLKAAIIAIVASATGGDRPARE
jgi:hypothetical protein